MKNENRKVKIDALDVEKGEKLSFANLISVIEQTHNHFLQQAVKAVNVTLTVRNWLIGFYIVEFEQKGEDRAKYGAKLIDSLAEEINKKGLGNRNLKLFKQFYLTYRNFNCVIFELIDLPNNSFLLIVKSKTAQLQPTISSGEIVQLPTAQLHGESKNYIGSMLKNISFTHFAELIKITDPTKRTFYELFILQTTPTVQDLKRQINTLAFERVGFSSNQELANEQLLKKNCARNT